MNRHGIRDSHVTITGAQSEPRPIELCYVSRRGRGDLRWTDGAREVSALPDRILECPHVAVFAAGAGNADLFQSIAGRLAAAVLAFPASSHVTFAFITLVVPLGFRDRVVAGYGAASYRPDPWFRGA